MGISSLLSSISGQFGKALLLGTFFPVVVFVIVFLFLVAPLLPTGMETFHLFESLEKEWKLATLTIMTVAGAGLLYNLNTPLLRLYEGYPWKESVLGRLWLRRQETRFLKAHSILERTKYLSGDAAFSKYQPEQIAQALDKAARITTDHFPNKKNLLLPTRLGNFIRAFEVYPNLQYEMSAISLFPRLIAKIETGYAAAIDEPKTRLDFMLNSSALSALMAFLVLLFGSSGRFTRISPGRLFAEVVLLSLISYLMYLGTFSPAGNWGLQVKGAFDLYRLSLLKQLGYDWVPADLEEERYVWSVESRRLVFPTADLPLVAYKQPSTRAFARPYNVAVSVNRALDFADANSAAVIRITVNVDPKADAKEIVVYETPPATMEYLIGSAGIDAKAIVPVGSNPMRFDLGPATAGTMITILYKAIPPATRPTAPVPISPPSQGVSVKSPRAPRNHGQDLSTPIGEIPGIHQNEIKAFQHDKGFESVEQVWRFLYKHSDHGLAELARLTKLSEHRLATLFSNSVLADSKTLEPAWYAREFVTLGLLALIGLVLSLYFFRPGLSVRVVAAHPIPAFRELKADDLKLDYLAASGDGIGQVSDATGAYLSHALATGKPVSRPELRVIPANFSSLHLLQIQTKTGSFEPASNLPAPICIGLPSKDGAPATVGRALLLDVRTSGDSTWAVLALSPQANGLPALLAGAVPTFLQPLGGSTSCPVLSLPAANSDSNSKQGKKTQ